MKEQEVNVRDMSFDEVSKRDEALYQLAMYDVTNGLLYVPKSEEDVVNFKVKVANRFNYLKKAIQSGECTFEFLRDTILSKNGAFQQEKITDEESAERVIKQAEEPNDPIAQRNPFDILSSIFSRTTKTPSGIDVVMLDDAELKKIIYGQGINNSMVTTKTTTVTKKTTKRKKNGRDVGKRKSK